MRQTTVPELIRALSPLLANTTVSSPKGKRNWNKEFENAKSPAQFIATYLTDLGTRITWVSCQKCGREWNNVTDSGACVGCTDAEQAAAKRDHDNGELLLKSIGRFGLEHYGLENFQRTDENETAFVLAEQFDPLKDNLYMWGACGVGKTHLAGAIFKAAAAGGFRLRWTDPIYLARGTRGRFGNEDESFIADVAATDVLVIDDLGIGRDNATILQTVYEILKIRRNAQRNGLIITSNHSLDELSKKYGDDRFASRVSGMCAVVKMSGNDRRFSSKT